MRRAADDSTEGGDHAGALMREVGLQLRHVREERGESLDDIAEILRIRPSYLEGIEAGDLSAMPGRTYALGFLRSYADYLGFDGDDLITQIRSAVDDLTAKTRLQIRTPLPESRLPRTPVVVLSLALVAGIYAGWVMLKETGDIVVETVAEVPADLRELAVGSLTADSPPPDPSPTKPERGDGAQPSAPGAQADRAPANGEAETPAAARSGDEPAPANPVASDPPSQEEGSRQIASASPGMGNAPVRTPSAEPARGADGGEGASTGAVAGGNAITPAAGSRVATEASAGGERPEDGPPAAADEPAAPLAIASAEPARDEGPVPSPAAGAVSRAGDGAGTSRPPPDSSIVPDAGPANRTRPSGPEDAGGVISPASSGDPEPGDNAAATASETPPSPTEPPPNALDVIAALDPALLEGGPEAPVLHERQNRDARIVLRGTGSSWIQIRSRSGDYLRSRTLEPGDAFLVPNRDDLVLWTGNAGGLQVIIDGEPLPELGADGTIIRSIPLTILALTARARG